MIRKEIILEIYNFFLLRKVKPSNILVITFFLISCATIIFARYNSELHTTFDSSALADIAQYYRKEKLPKSTIAEAALNAQDCNVNYGLVNWWAVGSSYILSFFGDLNEPKGYHYKLNVSVIFIFTYVLWLIFLYNKISSIGLLEKIIFCISPIFLTPNIDIDEYYLFLFIPLFLILTAKITILRMAVAVIMTCIFYNLRYQTIIFLPILLILLLTEKKYTFTLKITAQFLMIFLFLGTNYFVGLLLSQNVFNKPSYLKSSISVWEFLQHCYLAIRNSSLFPITGYFEWFIPSRISDAFVSEIGSRFPSIGVTVFFIVCVSGVYGIYRFLNKKDLISYTLTLFFFNYIILLAATALNENRFNLLAFNNYYRPFHFLFISTILFNFIFFKSRIAKQFLSFLILSCYLFNTANLLAERPSKAKNNFFGFSYAGDELAKSRKHWLQPMANDMVLDEKLNSTEKSILLSRYPMIYKYVNKFESIKNILIVDNKQIDYFLNNSNCRIFIVAKCDKNFLPSFLVTLSKKNINMDLSKYNLIYLQHVNEYGQTNCIFELIR